MKVRLALFALSGLCLVGALWGGVVRLGWGDFSPLIGSLPGIHGPLIICGFLGTFFSLERAATMENWPGYLAPLLTVVGALVLITDPMSDTGPILVVAGSFAFLVVCLILFMRGFTLFPLFIFLGSFQWFMGNCIWLAKWPVYNVTLWWMSFVVLTTAGERLEIAQMMHVNVGAKLFLLLGLGAVFVGHILTATGHLTAPDDVMTLQGNAIFDPRVRLGMKAAGIGMTLAGGWFLMHDPARTRWRNGGLAGYIAVCMISSYVWLAVSGVLSFVFAGIVSGPLYDAFIHTFFLGFLMFMVFGHGPVLVPSLLGLFLNMRKSLWAVPLLLHASLLLRVLGNMWNEGMWRKVGGLLNVGVIAYFLIVIFGALILDNRAAPAEAEN